MRWMWEVAARSYRRQSTYRAATAAGVFTNTVFGFILAYVLLAVVRERPVIGGFDAVDVVTFTFVMQGMLMVIGIFGSLEIAERVRSGDVVSDLYRPVDFQAFWLADAYGKSTFYAIFRGIPPFLVGALVFHLRLPASASIWFEFFASVFLAIAVSFGWSFLLQLTSFWLLDVKGPHQLGWLVAQFFSGVFVPVVFFPAWLGAIAHATPFPAMAQLPVEIFLGKHRGLDLLGVYAQQVLWVAVVLGAGRIMLARAMRKVVVQGG
ncbi:MAG TPA: ABC-2 family transporter protein [Acidimicrobiales bacterium]|jgi:ABC-2 type transport system permease protein|nr:ABC-2 family transporter protein [Acidimicrobiales bacterium]